MRGAPRLGLAVVLVLAALAASTSAAHAHPSAPNTLTVDLVLDDAGLVMIDVAANRTSVTDAPSPDERAVLADELLDALGVPRASAKVDPAESLLYHEVGFTIRMAPSSSNTAVPGGFTFDTAALQRVAAGSVGNLLVDVCQASSSVGELTITANAPSGPPDEVGAGVATDRVGCRMWGLPPDGNPVHVDARITVPEEGVLDCHSPISGAAKPPGWVQPIGGALALQTAEAKREKPALQIAPLTDSSVRGFTFFAKTGLYVRADGKQATVSVPRSERGRIAMTWGNTDHDVIASRSFEVGPCSGGAKWIVFPGGYYVTEPDCFELRVRVGRDVTPIRVGIGAPCRGQRPPPA
jgi:hypothetical protein